MLADLTAPDLTFVFIGVVLGLGFACVTILWHIEQGALRRSRGRKP